MALIIFRLLITVGALALVYYQIVVPAREDRPLFPWFKKTFGKKSQLEEIQEDIEHVHEDKEVLGAEKTLYTEKTKLEKERKTFNKKKESGENA